MTAQSVGPAGPFFQKVKPFVSAIADRLGIQMGKGRRYAPCPACSATTTADGRAPVRIFANDRQWICNRCSAKGDAYDMVRYARGGDFMEAKCWIEGTDAAEPLPPRPPPGPPPPPQHELRHLLQTALRAREDDEVAAFLQERRIDPQWAPALATPTKFSQRWWPQTWSRSYRLLVPAWDAHGHLVTVHARAIDGARPKTRWPRGCRASGTVFANVHARRMLAGRGPDPKRLVFAEGLTDYLHWATWSLKKQKQVAVIGVESGSFTAVREMRIPSSVRVYSSFDPDPAGWDYGRQLTQLLAPRPVQGVPLSLLGAA